MSRWPSDPSDVVTETAVRLAAGAVSEVRRLLVFWPGGNVVHPLRSTGKITVGRSRECDVRIQHGDVSRVHLTLHLDPRLAVEDLGSANGTWLNGTRLVPHAVTPLRRGDLVEAGTVVLLVQEATGGRASTRPTSEPSRQSGMDRVTRLIEVVAPSAISVLLLGETGVGKDVTARAIHARSPRAKGPFVSVNCAALPEALLESELFGHERGAFTGAVAAKPGLFEAAAGGTLFLNEVAELPLMVQAKLLSALESRQVTRVGGVHARGFDVRFIAATNQEIELSVERGSFRRDLYFRLNGVSIRIPPLRERLGEMPLLVDTFIRDSADARGTTVKVSDAAFAALYAHGWPGNIRELRSVIERAVLLASGGTVEPEDLDLAPVSVLPAGPRAAAPRAGHGPLREEMVALERQRIEEALRQCDGNQTRAAELLGMSRRTLVKRLGQYALTKRPRRE